jgi:two-component system nitrate/nitrite response regulator NarL
VTRRYRTLIVDDNRYARQAVAEVLAGDERFEIVGSCGSAEEAIAAAAALRPDLVLLDVRMPGLNGIAATARIRACCPECHVVMLTVSEDARDLFEAIRNGAQGYLLKNLEPEQWHSYLVQIMSGDAPISQEIAARILHYFAAANPLSAPPAAEALTAREAEVLEALRGGLSNREIAVRLGIAEGTVKNHLQHILAKLHLRNRTALALFAADSARQRGPQDGQA